jgi:hypothetical protein
MVGWTWRRQHVSAQDILSAANTLAIHASRYEIDLIPGWTSSALYLSWAQECFAQNNDFGWDAAVCYAKRASCREIDAFMVYHHLGHLRATYPEKIELLSKVGISIPEIIHELIIEPRNDIEHSYKASTFEQAKRAVQLSGLLLRATADEREHRAIISIGWSINIHEERRSTPGNEYERIDFAVTHQHGAMLLIDVCTEDHQVMVIHPKDEEILICPMNEFSKNEAVQLAQMLRKHYALENSGSWGVAQKNIGWVSKLKEDLGL